MKDAVSWAFLALSASSCDVRPRLRDGQSDVRAANSGKNPPSVLHGPRLLFHHAVLAGFALVGALLAHVQVSTRLVCSSCPAFYWQVNGLALPASAGATGGAGERGGGGSLGFSPCTWLLAIGSYFVLYNFLGVVMHVNWLPWT